MRFLIAFYTPDDGYQHPIVATDTGDIFEIFYKPNDFHITGSLTNFPAMVALSGFYAADDQMRILIVGQQDGSIHEIFYRPDIGVHITQPPLAMFSGILGISVFYTSDDKYRHVIVTDTGGNVTEVFYPFRYRFLVHYCRRGDSISPSNLTQGSSLKEYGSTSRGIHGGQITSREPVEKYSARRIGELVRKNQRG